MLEKIIKQIKKEYFWFLIENGYEHSKPVLRSYIKWLVYHEDWIKKEISEYLYNLTKDIKIK